MSYLYVFKSRLSKLFCLVILYYFAFSLAQAAPYHANVEAKGFGQYRLIITTGGEDYDTPQKLDHPLR
jgi:hypothetical protein